MCRRFSEKVLFVGHDLFQQRIILHSCYTTLVFRNDNNIIVVAKNSFGKGARLRHRVRNR